MTLAAVYYPDTLPCPTRDSYSILIDAGVINTGLGTSSPVQRRTYTNLPSIMDLVFNVQATRVYSWQWWVNVHGYSWFNMSLSHPFNETGALKEWIPIRFVAGSLGMSFDNYNNVVASIQAEISPVVYAERGMTYGLA